MPCTFTTIKMQERQRAEELERAKMREEERKREEVSRKKKALLMALAAMGFAIESSEEVEGTELITASGKE